MTARPRAGVVELGAAVAGVALTAAWLRFGPPLADGLAGSVAGAGGEALFTAILFLPMLALAFAGAGFSGLFAGRLGARPLPSAARGLALGAGGVLLTSFYTWVAGTLGQGEVAGAGVALLFGTLVVAMQVLAEEALFRGWLQPVLARTTGGAAAVAIVAIVFAGLHLLAGAQGLVTLVNLLLGGALFGVLALRAGGISGAFAAHFGWNAGEQLLLGLDPNPGVGGFGSLLNLDLAGPALWGGSDGGLNSSLAMSFALATILAPLLVAGIRTSR